MSAEISSICPLSLPHAMMPPSLEALIQRTWRVAWPQRKQERKQERVAWPQRKQERTGINQPNKHKHKHNNTRGHTHVHNIAARQTLHTFVHYAHTCMPAPLLPTPHLLLLLVSPVHWHALPVCSVMPLVSVAVTAPVGIRITSFRVRAYLNVLACDVHMCA